MEHEAPPRAKQRRQGQSPSIDTSEPMNGCRPQKLSRLGATRVNFNLAHGQGEQRTISLSTCRYVQVQHSIRRHQQQSPALAALGKSCYGLRIRKNPQNDGCGIAALGVYKTLDAHASEPSPSLYRFRDAPLAPRPRSAQRGAATTDGRALAFLVEDKGTYGNS